MKLDEALSIIERFFLDVIGTVFGGAFFLTLASFFFGLPVFTWIATSNPPGLALFLGIGACYTIGHFLTGIGFNVVQPFAQRLLGWMYEDAVAALKRRQAAQQNRLPGTNAFLHAMKTAFAWTSEEEQKKEKSLDQLAAVELSRILKTQGYVHGKIESFHDLRNFALSVEGVDKPLAYRFQFLGLFNLTTASAIALALGLWCIALLIQAVISSSTIWPAPMTPRPFTFGYLLAGLVLVPTLLERSARFYGISMRVPLSEAVMRLGQMSTVGKRAKPETKPAGLPKVYLAGGFRSGWQDSVRSRFAGQLEFIDPRLHQLADKTNYTAWDLRGVESADYVLAYLERDNPGGYALALEVGYAKALGKTVFYADETAEGPDDRSRYLDMVRAAATYRSASLSDALHLINSLLQQKLL